MDGLSSCNPLTRLPDQTGFNVGLAIIQGFFAGDKDPPASLRDVYLKRRLQHPDCEESTSIFTCQQPLIISALPACFLVSLFCDQQTSVSVCIRAAALGEYKDPDAAADRVGACQAQGCLCLCRTSAVHLLGQSSPTHHLSETREITGIVLTINKQLRESSALHARFVRLGWWMRAESHSVNQMVNVRYSVNQKINVRFSAL